MYYQAQTQEKHNICQFAVINCLVYLVKINARHNIFHTSRAELSFSWTCEFHDFLRKRTKNTIEKYWFDIFKKIVFNRKHNRK